MNSISYMTKKIGKRMHMHNCYMHDCEMQGMHRNVWIDFYMTNNRYGVKFSSMKVHL